MTAEPPDGPDDRTDGDVGGTGTPSLKERQRTWERAYRFRLWDAQGGPSRLQRWCYEHPTAAALGFVTLALGTAAAFGLLPGSSGSAGRFPTFAIVFAVLARWNLPIIRELHDEWRADRPASATDDGSDAGSGDPRRRRGSWLQRSDERHQALSDAEREVGSVLDQPAARIVGAVYAIQFAVALGVVLVIELVRWLVT